MNILKVSFLILICGIYFHSDIVGMNNDTETNDNKKKRKNDSDQKDKKLKTEQKKKKLDTDQITFNDEKSKDLLMTCMRFSKLSSEEWLGKIKLLIEEKADPNAHFESISENGINHNTKHITPIILVCKQNSLLNFQEKSLDALVSLLNAKADPNCEHLHHNTPLLKIYGHVYKSKNYLSHPSLEMIKVLIESKADVETKDEYNNTLLHKICIAKDNLYPKTFDPSLALQAAKMILFEFINLSAIRIQTICKTDNKHKIMIITYLLCLKNKSIKIPKYIIYKIFETALVPELLQNFINIKNTYEEPESALTRIQKEDCIELQTFFTNLQEAITQGYEAIVNFLGKK